jgi:quercetin dioxygenase-like cupin family protein
MVPVLRRLPTRMPSLLLSTQRFWKGAIRTSVDDGPVVTYRAGQNFPEMPGDRHSLDENASKTEPAKLLAVFVVDTDEKELLTPYEK